MTIDRFEAAPPEDRTIIIHDTTNTKNLLLLIQLRWLAVAGQVVTILVVQFAMGIALPLPAMAAVVAFLAALNGLSLLRARHARPVTHAELLVELALDVAALTVQLYLSGGASNPFVSLYLLQVILGAVLLEAWATWALVVLASLCFLGLTQMSVPLAMPAGRGESELLRLHILGMFVCFVLAASLLVLFITRINRNLRARDAHLATLRQRSAEEDHIVRMGLLASGAAHELGTPLATLSVIVGDWQRMPVLTDDPDLKGEIAEMQSQLTRCKAIVSGILMSSGEARAEGTMRTSASAFLDDLAGEWRSSRSPARFAYANEIADDPAIVSDVALKQVIFNVLDNALEASPAWVGLKAMREGDAIVLTVRDRGPGFDPDILATIGKPYRSTKNRPGGGLGLFLVVNVVRKLGGTVRAENDPVEGARVTLHLPLAALSPDIAPNIAPGSADG